MVLFNWYELKSGSENVPEGIITLTYALSRGYNSIISSSESSLLSRLNIEYVPVVLFRKRLLAKNLIGIVNNYECKLPQSYFTNTKWLLDKESTYNKLVYLYLLSQRSINNKNLFIPDYYVSSILWDNPYIEHKEEKLWFKPELTHKPE